MPEYYSNDDYDIGRATLLPFQVGGSSYLVFLKIAVIGAALITALYALATYVTFTGLGDLIAAAEELDRYGEPPPEAFGAFFAAIWSIMWPVLVIALPMWMIYAACEAAVHRWGLLGAHRRGGFPLRFGADELRVMAAQFLVNLISSGVILIVYLVMVAAMGVTVASSLESGEEPGAGFFAVLGLGMLVIFFIGLPLAAFLSVRLAPTSALSIYRGRFSLGEAWTVNKGHFWHNTGAYLIVVLAGYFLLAIIQTIFMMLAMLPLMGLIGQASDSPEVVSQALLDYVTNPLMMIFAVALLFVMILSSILFSLHIASVATYAVERIKIDDEKTSAFN